MTTKVDDRVTSTAIGMACQIRVRWPNRSILAPLPGALMCGDGGRTDWVRRGQSSLKIVHAVQFCWAFFNQLKSLNESAVRCLAAVRCGRFYSGEHPELEPLCSRSPLTFPQPRPPGLLSLSTVVRWQVRGNDLRQALTKAIPHLHW